MYRVRLPHVATLVSATFLISIIPAHSATIAGTKCTKLNSTKTVANIKYTCVKSGLKLIWNKGVALKPIASPSPLPTTTSVASPTPSPTNTATPTPTPVTSSAPPSLKPWTPPVAPTSWGDVVINADGIAYWAWKKTTDKILGKSSKLGTIEIIVSPHGKPDNPTPLVALNLVSRFTAEFNEPKKVVIVYADESDIEWGQTEINKFCAPNACGHDVTSTAKKACNVPITPCWGAVALQNLQTGIPMMYITASNWGKSNPNHVQGTLEAHEYFHNVQDMLLAYNSIDHIPRWLTEGGATWVSAATVFHSDFDAYLRERANNNNETLVRRKPDAAWLEKFLDPNYKTGWDLWNGNTYEDWMVYDIGALASEIMVAISGPDAYLNLYKSVGEGKSFAQAFENIYGIPWSQGAKVIAQAIVAQQK